MPPDVATAAAAAAAEAAEAAAATSASATAPPPPAPAADAASHDPFSRHASFRYAPNASVRAAYPLPPRPRVPDHIVRPNYAREALFASRKIKTNTEAEQEGVRKAARLAREVLEAAAAAVRPGVRTEHINDVVLREAFARDCYPSPLGYHGFPGAVCTSVNEIICHGIPDKRPLEDGDIINIDVTLYHHGFHGDLNATYPVGDKARADADSLRLIDAARDCLDAAIAICGPGVPYAEIGKVIEPLAKSRGCAVVKRYTGHGVGTVFHAAPTIYHHVTRKAYGVMQPGHIFTIEPMLNLGSEWRDLSWPDDWTVSTVDGARSAAAEETLLVTRTGVEVLTARGGPRRIDTRAQRQARNERGENGGEIFGDEADQDAGGGDAHGAGADTAGTSAG